MKYSPLDIRHQEFPQRLGGYDRASVRAFLHDVADELETLLQRQQEQQESLVGLEKQLEERKQHEDEIRRAVISAERIAHELRENAARESDLLIAQATVRRDGLLQAAEGRTSELESQHQARMSALEAAFRSRFAELERQLHDLTLERDRMQAQRLMELEREFSERHSELNGRLSAARMEYAQFLSTYRTLMTSFADMSARHILPAESALAAPRLPAHELHAPLDTPPLSPAPEQRPEAPEPAADTARPAAGDTAPEPPEGQQFL